MMQPPWIIDSAEERDALPAGVIVHSADGTIACRHHTGVGVVFGMSGYFEWSHLAMPIEVVMLPGGGERFPAGVGMSNDNFPATDAPVLEDETVSAAARKWAEDNPRDDYDTTLDRVLDAFEAGAAFAAAIVTTNPKEASRG